jgi:hypothetical protein
MSEFGSNDHVTGNMISFSKSLFTVQPYNHRAIRILAYVTIVGLKLLLRRIE